ncbi:hypothetical protein NIES25_09870 [Nostoc linckia NIES-25]|nr:hypothetical protein NIES25_09870 [Nostoc linckia NIES-25]
MHPTPCFQLDPTTNIYAVLVCFKRMSEKFLVLYSIFIDPPKSPLKRETLILVPPFLRGASAVLGSPQVERLAWARGDQAKYLILLRHPLSR